MRLPVALPAAVPAWRVLDARVPACLVSGASVVSDADGLAAVDITIADGRIASLLPAGVPAPDASDLPVVDLAGGMVVPALVDVHTHIDKGHIADRTPDADGTHGGAVRAVLRDRSANWHAQDVRRRMEFSLRCAHAHGTAALRTHVDSLGAQARISWPVFAEMRDSWRDRITLQASPLFSIESAADAAHMATVIDMVELAGCRLLGAVTYMNAGLEAQLDTYFRIAGERGYDLDFHVDETRDPDSRSLRAIADAALRHRFQGRILAGHCCSLSVQPDDEMMRTIERVAEAGIAVVSLPMCNMYLQDRAPGRTPRWRGVTALHELAAAGVPVMIASDNTRDPFYAYGDLDMVEVWREGTRILQLDHPVDTWPRVVATAPAQIMGLPDRGLISPGGPADLILIRARSWNDLFTRPQSDRTVIRNGRVLEAEPPQFGHLEARA